MDKKKNVFISHYGKDHEKIEALKALLSQKGYSLRDSSVSSKENNASTDSYIKNQLLLPKINWAGQMIVLIGKDTYKRAFVNWEIEQAHKKGMQITGVYLNGGRQEEYLLPENFQKYGSSLTGWNTDTIIKSLNGQFHKFKTPDNLPQASFSKLSRGNC